MTSQISHQMLAKPLPDEMARQRFVLALKRQLAGSLRNGVAVAYEKVCEPSFVASHGRPPASRHEAEEALDLSSHHRLTKSINRTSQEMMWQSVGETVYREMDRIEGVAAELINHAGPTGSLTLDPGFEPDPVYRNCFIHLQPEGYCPPDDAGTSVAAGAFYESGGRVYSMGRGMGKEDSKAEAVIGWLAESCPGWRPRRILDMGCSAGGASTVYPEAFPDAEVHAIDLGSSMLRYAHARAEAIGVPVHFHQMDATHTGFPDRHFDLIVSHNLLHEISTKDRQAVARESLRLLADDGTCVHQDVDLLFRGKSHWEEAERAYDHKNNNEPFWVDYATCDFLSELRATGFDPARCRETQIRKVAGPGYWYAFIASKP